MIVNLVAVVTEERQTHLRVQIPVEYIEVTNELCASYD